MADEIMKEKALLEAADIFNNLASMLELDDTPFGIKRDDLISKKVTILTKHKFDELIQLTNKMPENTYTLPWYYFESFLTQKILYPNTIGAKNKNSNVVFVLQDWSSHDTIVKLKNSPTKKDKKALESIEKNGFDIYTQTNINLASLINNYINKNKEVANSENVAQILESYYIINIFPLIKPQTKNDSISPDAINLVGLPIAKHILNILRPAHIVCLGRDACRTIIKSGGNTPSNKLESIVAESIKKIEQNEPDKYEYEWAKEWNPQFWYMYHTGSQSYSSAEAKKYNPKQWEKLADALAKNR